jgi:arylsulfatase A-like enzyme
MYPPAPSYRAVLFDNDNRRVRLPGYRVDALADAAIRYIDRHRRRRFFLFVSFLEPHQQNHLDDYPPPDGWRERYTGRWMPPDLAALGGSAHQHLGGYCGMVKRLDEAFGRMLDALKSLELLDNTIVLFSSDHGCHFKTRNAEYKRSCHESSIRVPTALYGQRFIGGGRVNQLVSLVDLPPTLLDAAGLPVPRQMQGRSVLRLLNGRATAWPEEVFIQISESQVGRALRTRRWKYSVVAPDKHGWQHSASERYIEEFLYDLEADPHELTNLAGLESHAELAAVLRQRLIGRMLAAGEARPLIRPATARRAGQRKVPPADLRL